MRKKVIARTKAKRKIVVEKPTKPVDEVWTTRDGTEIMVGDMSDHHVRSALRMILRHRRQATQRK